MRRLVTAFFLLLVVPVASETQEKAAPQARQPVRCKGSPKVVGDCFTIKGRLSQYCGSCNSRIWRIGTKRMLGVCQVENVQTIPQHLENEFADFETEIYGDFEVGPLTKERLDEMQIVCIESASRLAVRHR